MAGKSPRKIIKLYKLWIFQQPEDLFCKNTHYSHPLRLNTPRNDGSVGDLHTLPSNGGGDSCWVDGITPHCGFIRNFFSRFPQVVRHFYTSPMALAMATVARLAALRGWHWQPVKSRIFRGTPSMYRSFSGNTDWCPFTGGVPENHFLSILHWIKPWSNNQDLSIFFYSSPENSSESARNQSQQFLHVSSFTLPVSL